MKDNGSTYWQKLMDRQPRQIQQVDLARMKPDLRKAYRPPRPPWIDDRARQLVELGWTS